MSSEQPPGGWPEYPSQPDSPYGRAPSQRGLYEQEPPADPYPPQRWQPPPGGPYQQRTPNGYYEQPPRRKRRLGLKITLGVIGGFFALIVLGSIAAALGGSGSSTGTNAGTGTAASQSSSGGTTTHAAGIGDSVRDGKFQFKVTKVTHAKRIGSHYLGQKAQGEYTILHVTVTNIGNQAQNLDDSAQFIYDAHGRKFSADSTADIYANGSSNSVFFNQINPGNSVRGKIAFDLPKGDTAVKAELHDSVFSGGVVVSLR